MVIDYYRIESALNRIDKLNSDCERNMQSLRLMMQELKGIVAIVRPQAKKTGWYGDEIEAKGNIMVESKGNLLEVKDNE